MDDEKRTLQGSTDQAGGQVEPRWRVSRRSFLQAAGAGAALAAVPTGAKALGQEATPLPAMPELPESWDEEADIVVVGSGGAALTAAVIAAEQGNQVVVLEKAPDIGGTTAKSGGVYWIPNNSIMREMGLEDPREDALNYLVRAAYPQLYNPDDPQLGLPELEYQLIEAFYDNGAEAIDTLGRIGAVTSGMTFSWNGEPTIDYLEHLPENKAPRGRAIGPVTESGDLGAGDELIRQLRAAAEQRNVPLETDRRVTGVYRNNNGEVVGVAVAGTEEGGAPAGTPALMNVRARKAVIFGSGGFTHNPELTLNFQRGPVLGGCAVPTNEGDFVNIGIDLGAQLGNMRNAFRAQVVFEQAMEFASVPSDVWWIIGDSVILANRYGKRVVNEKRNYNDRTEAHYDWDPVYGTWTNLLLFMIYDQRTADLWAGSYPIPASGVEAPYLISADTLDDLASEIDSRLETHAARTGGFRLDSSFVQNLQQTIERFNGFAEAGKDDDFQRGDFPYDRDYASPPPTAEGVAWPPEDQANLTMHPISDTGPYYAIILAPGTLDTNGGPVVDAQAHVLTTTGDPIPGLYGAGNCIASPAANTYWGGGGTIGPAMVFGYIAGMNASEEPTKQV